MKSVLAVAATAVIALTGTVTVAQTVDPMAGVPAADQTRITKCKAMKPGAMTKSATCQKMMKLYPTAFAGTASSN